MSNEATEACEKTSGTGYLPGHASVLRNSCTRYSMRPVPPPKSYRYRLGSVGAQIEGIVSLVRGRKG